MKRDTGPSSAAVVSVVHDLADVTKAGLVAALANPFVSLVGSLALLQWLQNHYFNVGTGETDQVLVPERGHWEKGPTIPAPPPIELPPPFQPPDQGGTPLPGQGDGESWDSWYERTGSWPPGWGPQSPPTDPVSGLPNPDYPTLPYPGGFDYGPLGPWPWGE